MVYFKKMFTVQVAVLLGGMFAGLTIAMPVAELDEVARDEIAERIKPAGTLCVAGEECAASDSVAVASGPRSGEQVFSSYCTACHTAGVLGAPKKGDKAAWDKRLADSGSFQALMHNAINGIRAMPAKGTCGDCSSDEISGAIQYMSGLEP